MNRRIVLILIFILVLVGIIVIAKQREQAANIEQMETQAANELRRLAAEAQAAKQKALEETNRIEAEAQLAKQKALDEARRAEAEAQEARQLAQEAVRQKAEEIQGMVDSLVTQATSMLDAGQYQQAIDIAKKILADDPNNPDAKSIIERATAMLKEAAQEKADALMQRGQESVGGAL